MNLINSEIKNKNFFSKQQVICLKLYVYLSLLKFSSLLHSLLIIYWNRKLMGWNTFVVITGKLTLSIREWILKSILWYFNQSVGLWQNRFFFLKVWIKWKTNGTHSCYKGYIFSLGFLFGHWKWRSGYSKNTIGERILCAIVW